ncbi:extracellular solute-binding protein [Paenibacillus rhizovicinus]|uniref:Extracellular solute-binding protein n=2 Tax=Paenibacillus rhizovicinus TaxID=2704463 RepID=A0A6C0P8R9_9BACL|nr:extracellular solute-binding protein [Paenibacillus rhizovicinus]
MDEALAGKPQKGSYAAYLAAFKDEPKPEAGVTIPAGDYASANDMKAKVMPQYEGAQGEAVWTDESGSIAWNVDVPATGLYNMAVDYFPIEGKSAAIERQILIDGQAPFTEAGSIVFSRVWGSASAIAKRDDNGNDIRPQEIEKPVWQQAIVKDAEGSYEQPFYFHLSAGKHTITFVSLREPMVIGDIRLMQQPATPTYAEASQAYASEGLKPVKDALVKVQGEQAVRVSDPTLYPSNDRSSPATEPYDVSKIRMNMIGGHNWRMPGQWIEWDVEAPEDGLYRIAFKSRQNELRGLYATRKLTIDGTIPFQEAKEIRFLYDRDWSMGILGGSKDPYLFKLAKGKHTIRLEVSLGDVAPMIRAVQNAVLELNALYRDIIKITGSTPDPNRDYHLDRQVPGLVSRFNAQSKLLYGIGDALEQLTGEKSEQVAALYRTAYQLEDMAKRPDTIQDRLDTYKVNVGSLGTWLLTVREQPLDIDYLLLAGTDVTLPKANASWLAKVKHESQAFLYSFFEDYNSLGDVSSGDGKQGGTVTVWIGTGRDQAQALKSMIDDTFTPETGIKVDLKLVQMGNLLPATLAGEGPDVAMQIDNQTPVNFAMRNAAQDLTVFKDFAQVASRFRDSAMVPYRYGDNVYALPEQQSFGMLFYRKDVLDELGLKVPQTWDDVYDMIPVLQKNNMQFELPLEQNFARMPSMAPNAIYTSLLFQSNGRLYANGGKRSDLDSEASMRSFRQWTEFYTNYRMPLTFDFPNRFRTGEMPIGIADYTLYNNLTVSAPEIRGLWDFAPIPGTKAASGEIRRDEGSSGTSVMMPGNAAHKDNAWSFMKWWTSTDTQVRFGREMEGLMGAAARYPTANTEALAELPWPVKDYRSLQEQWEWVQGIPEVPGGYYTGRQIDNAFRKVVNENANARETLYDYTRSINDEISLKRSEFKLPD